jgi:hypothetical protein
VSYKHEVGGPSPSGCTLFVPAKSVETNFRRDSSAGSSVSLKMRRFAGPIPALGTYWGNNPLIAHGVTAARQPLKLEILVRNREGEPFVGPYFKWKNLRLQNARWAFNSLRTCLCPCTGPIS